VASFSSLFPDGAAPNEESPIALRQEDLCDDTEDDIAWLNINELTQEDTEDLTKCLDTCVERWKAAGPEARKKMFALFAVAGIFLTVCRHGHVIIMCDMIRSGELLVLTSSFEDYY
jgi:hypothetical protein